MNLPNPTPTPFSPSADPRDTLEACEGLIGREGWFTAAGVEEGWPITTADAAAMLAAGEYAVSAADLSDLVGRNLIPAPGVNEAGDFEWSATDLVQAAGILEGRGQWAATPSKHDPKKHPCRILLEQARAAGEVERIVTGGPVRFDLRHLLALLVACPSHEGRAKIAVLLEGLLEVDHEVRL